MIDYSPPKILFEIFGLKVYSWGLMAALAFLIVFFLAYKKVKKEKLRTEYIFDLALIILIFGFIGARLFWAFENGFDNFFKIWQGGLTWYGGLLFGLAGAFIYLKIKKLSPRYLEIIALYLPLGYAIARIGCFLNWDDYGLPTALWFGIKVANDVPRHPTQLYLSLASLLIFVILLIIDKKNKDKKDGKRFILTKSYLLVYAFMRFSIDFLRDTYRYAGLTFSQYTSIALITFILILEIKKFIKKNFLSKK